MAGMEAEILASTGGVVYDAVAIPSGGETVEFLMPNTFHTALVLICCQGDDTTDAATHSEEIRNVETVEVVTKEGEALRISGGNGLDVFNYARIITGDHKASYRVGGNAADEESVIVYALPLSLGLWDWFTPGGDFFAMPKDIANILRVTFASDTNTGMDSRAATVMAFGFKEPSPKAWCTTLVDSYTAVVDQSRWTELPANTRLRGVLTFHTTTFNDDTTNTVLSVKEQRLAYGRTTYFKRVKTILLQAGLVEFNQFTDPAAQHDTTETGAVNVYVSPSQSDEYTWWNLDPGNRGEGEPNPGNLMVESIGGVAEAVRLYPVVYRLV